MIKHLYTSIILILGINMACRAQVIENLNWNQQDEKIVIHYDLTGAKYFEQFTVNLFVSTDDGNTYTGPLQKVNGDIGSNIKEGRKKTILWDVLDEYPGFGGKVKFEIRADINPQKVRHKFFAGYNGSYYTPIGITAGLTGKVGFYLTSRINNDYFTFSEYTTDGLIVTDFNEQGYYSFIQGKKVRRLSATAGLMIQMNWKWHWYIGAGFSEYQLLWQIARYDFDDNETGTSWVKHSGESFNSVAAETGLLYNFAHFFLAGGIASPGFKWVEGTVSAGLTF